MVTIEHFSRASGVSKEHGGDFLHTHRMRKHLGMCGGVTIEGRGMAPKVYYLRRKGWEYFTEEGIDLGPFIEVNPKRVWTPLMRHRLQIVSDYQNLEMQLRQQAWGHIDQARFEFRRQTYRGRQRKETIDFISTQAGRSTTIVPDASLLVARSDGLGALMLLETDMGNEQLSYSPDYSQSIEGKLSRYLEYAKSGLFQRRYSDWGAFGAFQLMIVTKGAIRAKNIAALNEKFQSIPCPFWVTDRETFQNDALGDIWYRIGGGVSPQNIFGVS
jgi:hypothetical protein